LAFIVVMRSIGWVSLPCQALHIALLDKLVNKMACWNQVFNVDVTSIQKFDPMKYAAVVLDLFGTQKYIQRAGEVPGGKDS